MCYIYFHDAKLLQILLLTWVGFFDNTQYIGRTDASWAWFFDVDSRKEFGQDETKRDTTQEIRCKIKLNVLIK